MQASGGIDQKDIAAIVGGVAAGRAGKIDGRGFLGRSRVDRNLVVAGDDSQLLAGGGTVDVHRNDFGPVPVFREPARELTRGGGFSGTLQADNQENTGWLVGETELGFVTAQNFDQFLIDDADNLLRRSEGIENFLPHGTGSDGFNELFDNLKIDVGFEQCHANLAQRRLHVFCC